MNVPGADNPASSDGSSWEDELGLGGMLALALGVFFGGSALVAAGQAAVDPPKLGSDDALTFVWIFLATLPLAAGAAVFVWVLGHQHRTDQQFVGGVGVLVLGALCAVGSLWLSAWAVDAGVKDAIDAALPYLPSPENTAPPAEWPGWVDAYWTAGGGSPAAIVQRSFSSYLSAIGPVLVVAGFAVGAFAGWCASKVSAES